MTMKAAIITLAVPLIMVLAPVGTVSAMSDSSEDNTDIWNTWTMHHADDNMQWDNIISGSTSNNLHNSVNITVENNNKQTAMSGDASSNSNGHSDYGSHTKDECPSGHEASIHSSGETTFEPAITPPAGGLGAVTPPEMTIVETAAATPARVTPAATVERAVGDRGAAATGLVALGPVATGSGSTSDDTQVTALTTGIASLILAGLIALARRFQVTG